MTMAKPLSSKAPRESKLDATVIVSVVVCVVLAGAFAYWRIGPGKPVTEKNFQFAELEVERQKLASQRQQKYADADLQSVQAEWQELIAAAREANLAQFGGATEEEQLTLSTKVRVWANEVLLGSGFGSFAVAGEPLFRECDAGLDELLGAVQRGELTIEDAKHNPPADTYSAYRANCGKLLPTLVERGLVSEDGEWSTKDAPLIVDILSRYRWAHIIHDQKDPWAQLTREGARGFARWRVEQASGYTLAQRRNFLDKLVMQFPDYNATFTAGVLAYQAEDYDTALTHFEKLAEAQPRSDYTKYAEHLRQKTGDTTADDAAGNAATGATKGASETGPAAAEKTD
jgi:hypothetical protein